MPVVNSCVYELPIEPLHTKVKVEDIPPPSYVRANLELIKRVVMVSEVDLNKFAGAVETQEMMSEVIRRNSWESTVANKVHLKPGSSKQIQLWMARMFPTFLSDKSEVKQVRNFLAQSKARGENLWETMPFYGSTVNEVLAKIGSAEIIDDAYGQFKLILKNNNVDLSEADLGLLWGSAIETAQHGRIMRMTQAGDNGRRVLDNRLQKFYDMAESYGVSPEGAKVLHEPVLNVSKAYDDLWVFANSAGVDVDALQNMGYMNRVFSSDAKFRVGKAQADVYGGFLESNVKGLGAAFQKSRETYDFVVEDDLIVATALGLMPQGSPSAKRLRSTIQSKQRTLDRIVKARDVDLPEALTRSVDVKAKIAELDGSLVFVKNALKDAKPSEVSGLTNNFKSMQRMRDDLAGELTGLSSRIKKWQSEIGTVADSELALFDAQKQLTDITEEVSQKLATVLTNEKILIRELANLPDTTLDVLVDSGVLSKLEMTNETLFTFMTKKYKMPYKGIEELLLTDPRRAYSVATDQLKQLMGKSAMSQAMFANAIETGWGVSYATKVAEPDKFEKFVKLSPEVYKKFGVNNIPGAEDIYLHPTVANMYTAILEVSTDPSQLSTLAAVWQYANRMFKKQALATTGFVGRQVYQLFVSSAISGTNLANIIPAMVDYVKFKRVGFAALDNTKKIYGGGAYTERELMAELVSRGVMGDASAPIAGEIAKKANETYSALDPRNAARALGYWGTIINGRGIAPVIKNGKLEWDAVSYGAGLAEKMTDEASGYLMSIGVQLEQAAKLAHFRSTMRDGALNMIGQFITSTKRVNFTDVDEAIKHSTDYFFDYSNVGLGDKFISKNALPFWTYMSRNAPAVIRHVLRNPRQYMAYQRVMSLMNQDVRESGEEAPIGGFQEFQRGLGNIYMKHPSGNPNQFVQVPFAAFDPVADALGTFEDGANGLGQMFGMFPGAYDADLKQVSPKNDTIPFVDGLISNGYGSIKALAAVVTRKDANTGKSLVNDDTNVTSFLGVEIPGKQAPLVKYMIENTVPSVANLNRFNPLGMFGIKENTDGYGKVIRPAQKSWAGADRSDADVSIDSLNGNALAMALRFSGVTIASVDTVKGMGFTESKLAAAVTDMKAYASKIERTLKELQPDDPRRAKLSDTLITTKALAAEIELGRVNTQTWLTQRGAMTQTQKRKQHKDMEKMKLYMETFK